MSFYESPIKHKWLKIKYGRAFHVRVGVRREFLCGKTWTPFYRINGRLAAIEEHTPDCKECAAALAFLEDQFDKDSNG